MVNPVQKLGAGTLSLLSDMGRMLNFILYAVYTCYQASRDTRGTS